MYKFKSLKFNIAVYILQNINNNNNNDVNMHRSTQCNQFLSFIIEISLNEKEQKHQQKYTKIHK